jgi:putative ABC transport system permease protein
VESLVQDARIALRGLRRAPTFATTTVLILGLGIGMATAMFTVFRAVLIERLPVSSPDRLVVLRSLNRGSTKVDPSGTVIADMQREARTVRGVAGVYHFGSIPLPFLDAGRQIVINRSAVTANFFDVLGVRPLMGRLLNPEDGAEGRHTSSS